MVNFTEIPDEVKHNYRTLHHDIGLSESSNGQWDLWFENGDLVSATELNSLQVAIINACLTSWNYMNRYGNPTYEVYGNRSYELLKRNKSTMVQYKIQQYFLECLKRMRRVYEVIDLTVTDIAPYKYLVEFEVLSIDNSIVGGDFTVNTDVNKSSSFLTVSVNQPYSSPDSPMQVTLYLGNEYGMGLSDEIIQIYDIDLVYDEYTGEYVEDYTFKTIKGVTKSDGTLTFNYVPSDKRPDKDKRIKFVFRGNTLFNECESQTLIFESAPHQFHIDDDGLLYVNSSYPDVRNYIWLGEVVANNSEDMSWKQDKLSEPASWNKLYLMPNNLGSYDAYKRSGTSFSKKYEDIIVSTVNGNADIGELHLFVEDNENLYELCDNKESSSVNHIFYIDEEVTF